jgi:hypothetical protein
MEFRVMLAAVVLVLRVVAVAVLEQLEILHFRQMQALLVAQVHQIL